MYMWAGCHTAGGKGDIPPGLVPPLYHFREMFCMSICMDKNSTSTPVDCLRKSPLLLVYISIPWLRARTVP